MKIAFGIAAVVDCFVFIVFVIYFWPENLNPDSTNHGSGSWFRIANSVNRGIRMKSNPGTHLALEGPGRPRFIQDECGVKSFTPNGRTAGEKHFREKVREQE